MNHPTDPIPTDPQLALLVDEAFTLRAEITLCTERLKVVEGLIEAAALKGPHAPLKDASREGRQFFARSKSGLVLPIIFTSDSLIKSFHDKSYKHAELLALAGSPEHLGRLFKKPTKWESMWDDGQKFRAAATELLGVEKAVPFITSCRARDKFGIPKSSTKFDYLQALR